VFDLFRTLEFRSLTAKLPPAESLPADKDSARAAATPQLSLFAPDALTAQSAAPAPLLPRPLSSSITNPILISSLQSLTDLVSKLNKAKVIAVDTETTSIDPNAAALVGISLAIKEGEGYYIPVGHQIPTSQNPNYQLPITDVIKALTPPLTNPDIQKVNHNIQFDYSVLKRHGLTLYPITFDTMIAEWLADPGSHHLGLKNLALHRLGLEMTRIEDLLGKGKKQITFDQVPVEQAAPYAVADVDIVLRLIPQLKAELKEKGLLKLYEEVELPFIPVLAEMEMAGIQIDPDLLGGMSKDLDKQLKALEKKIYKGVGYEFNINSTQQLAKALFDDLKLEPPDKSRRTAAGKYSTAADVLDEMKDLHPVVAHILEHRELSKLKGTYVDALPGAINPETGRVHTSFNQCGSVTGRLASSNPNLQNIPIRTELGREVRKAFTAPRGRRLVAADYSQVELRIAAHFAKEKFWIDAFKRGDDIHAATASTVFRVSMDKVTKEQRRSAKCVAADTLIHTTKGLVRIGELASDMKPGEYRPITLTVVADTGLKMATHIYCDGHQPLKRIRLSGGLDIACTPDHQLRIIDRSGAYVWRTAADIRIGDFVALARGRAAFGDQMKLPDIEWPETLRTTNYRDLNLPTHWTPELARFLGYVVSEGYVYHHPTKRHSGGVIISQHVTDQDVVADMLRVCRCLFGRRVRVTERDSSVFYQIHSSKLVYWLDQIGVGQKSQQKAIPASLLKAPRYIQVEFIRALFAGDGSLRVNSFNGNSRRLTYVTKSPTLARMLQQILLNFGLYFRLRAEWRQGYPDPYYEISLGSHSALGQFMRDIGIVTKRKNDLASLTKYDLSIIPGQRERVRALYPLLRGAVREKAYETLRTSSPVRLNRVRANMIVDQLQAKKVKHPALNHLADLLNLDLDFVAVEAISDEEGVVYDLVVPDGNCYVANGVISHNTVNFGILYGQGAFGLAKTTGLTLGEAEEFIQKYFAELPGVKKYLDGTKRKAAAEGYVETLLGRRRYFPILTRPGTTREDHALRARAEREAINTPVQGTAADIIKLAMLQIARDLPRKVPSAHMLLQVHDELVFECDADDVEKLAALVKKIMEGAFKLDAPLAVDVRAGKNWEEMKAVD
jgi:DNA polymerase I-like protein with 3'-5' exonuclease and polymerase domains